MSMRGTARTAMLTSVILAAADICAAQQEMRTSLTIVARREVEKHFVIVGSSKRYGQAVAIARKAYRDLALKVNLRGLVPSKRGGLTAEREQCEAAGAQHPCYIARGTCDDGVYVSIEYSDEYVGLTPGLYIVVAASGRPDDQRIDLTLLKALPNFGDAYIRPVFLEEHCEPPKTGAAPTP